MRSWSFAALLAGVLLAAAWLILKIPASVETLLGAGGQVAVLSVASVLAGVRSRSLPALAATAGVLVLLGFRAAELASQPLPTMVAAGAAALAAVGVVGIFFAFRPGRLVTLDVGLVAVAVVSVVLIVESAPDAPLLVSAIALGLALGAGLCAMRPMMARVSVPLALGVALAALASSLLDPGVTLTAVWWIACGALLAAVFLPAGRSVSLAADLTAPLLATGAALAVAIPAASLAGVVPLGAWVAFALLAMRIGYGALRDRKEVLGSRLSGVRDPVTGLGSRSAFREALGHHLDEGGEPALLAVFDLHGFKHYNDAYGHLAGDGVLRHLSERLRAAVWPARTFRLRGDEFAVISEFSSQRPEVILDRAEAALGVRGHGFSIGAHVGAVVIPEEATDAAEAMRIADQRILIQRRANATGERWDALERQIATAREAIESDLSPDDADLAALALAVGAQLDLSRSEMLELARASSLHDLGRVAVPTTPDGARATGRAGEVERNRHLIGERLLASAPDMRGAGAVLRSMREHWDGTGGPDGLKGAAIPTPSRVLSVCEAYLLAHEGRGDADQIGALRRIAADAGTRFDPWVIAALRATVDAGQASGSGGELSA